LGSAWEVGEAKKRVDSTGASVSIRRPESDLTVAGRGPESGLTVARPGTGIGSHRGAAGDIAPDLALSVRLRVGGPFFTVERSPA
jgi:hypothetical protein